MLRVLYCDDEADVQSAFLTRHPNLLVTPVRDIHSVASKLSEMRPRPDLVVLDLYHTNASPGSEDAARVNAEVTERIGDVDRAVEALRKVVSKGKAPVALEVVRQIREELHSDVPILLFTRQGLSLLEDQQLLRAVSHDAEWMLKGRSPEFERGKMEAYVRRYKLNRRRVKRDVALTVAGAVLGLGLSMLWDLLR